MTTITITTGTTPKRIAHNFYNRRRKRLQQLEQLPPEQYSIAVQRQIQQIEDSLTQMLVLDIDTTETPSLNAAFDAVHPLPPGIFLECPMPGLDQIARIEAGDFNGQFVHFNPQACDAIKNTLNGAGGTRANGWLAFQHNRIAIQARIEQLVRQGLRQDQRLTILLISSTFGGFGSGTLEPLTQLIVEVLEQSGVRDRVNFQRIILAPGGM